jgi:nucleotide-binding universal stress UspA family protein
MIWKTILVPHDFSASANHAAAIARDEAKAHGGTLVLLHVVDIPSSFGPDATLVIGAPSEPPIGMQDYAIQQAKSHLEDLAKRLRADGVEVTFAVKIGNPVDQIVNFATESAATAIVMGTHGRTGLKHLLIGSVTERVVRTSPVPVLTTRHE